MNTDDTDRKSGDLVIAKPEGLPQIYADGRGSEQVKTSPRINTDGTDQESGSAETNLPRRRGDGARIAVIARERKSKNNRRGTKKRAIGTAGGTRGMTAMKKFAAIIDERRS